MNGTEIRVLLIDDDEDSYVLTLDLLEEATAARFDLEWIDTYEVGLEVVAQNGHDVCLLDYNLGERNGLELLHDAVDAGCSTPIIMLTGQGDHEIDLLAMKAGAADYLPKDHLRSELLERSIRYALERHQANEMRDELIARLEKALAHVKTLSGLLPICANCKKIRDDKGYWNQIENYLREHSGVEFSHGLCPECGEKLYPEYYQAIDEQPESD